MPMVSIFQPDGYSKVYLRGQAQRLELLQACCNRQSERKSGQTERKSPIALGSLLCVATITSITGWGSCQTVERLCSARVCTPRYSSETPTLNVTARQSALCLPEET